MTRDPVTRCLERVSVSESGCWFWNGAQTRDGYAIFTVGSRTDGTRRVARVHRWLYERLVGPVPDGCELDHLCHARPCVNPDHLEIVTHAENMRRSRANNGRRARSHCPSGHLYDAMNTHLTAEGWRVCRSCARERSARVRRAAKTGASL